MSVHLQRHHVDNDLLEETPSERGKCLLLGRYAGKGMMECLQLYSAKQMRRTDSPLYWLGSPLRDPDVFMTMQ